MTPTPREWVFLLPLPPNRANARKHWSAVQRERKQYEHECTMRMLAKMIPLPPKFPMERASISAQLVVGNYMDEDNAIARCKWAVDWLVKAGYLLNDTRKHLSWSGFPTQYLNRAEQSLTLTLTESND